MSALLLSLFFLLFHRPAEAGQPGQPFLTSSAQAPTTMRWSWTAAAGCGGGVTYTLINAADGTVISPPGFAATTLTENFSDPANTAYVRAVFATDATCSILNGPLSNSVTNYTLANSVLTISSSSIQTTSAVLSWNPGNTAPYTRFAVALSLDNFVASFSTPIALANNLTANTATLTGLLAGTTYFYRVWAYNGKPSDSFGNIVSSFSPTEVLVTLPSPPALTGTALSTGSIRWNWTLSQGATGYRLYESNGGPLLIDTPGLSYSSGALNANGSYGLVVYAYNSGGQLSPPTTTFAFALAQVPLTPTVSTVTANSVTMIWDPNGNSPVTTYEVFTAIDSFFKSTVSTVTVAQSTAVIQNLFPGTTYFFKLHAINGGQIATVFATPNRSTVTASVASIAQSTAPPTPYSNLANVVGLWHFDVNNGTQTPDSSIYGDSATLTCLDNACVSTPTFVAGPPFLGSAVSFQGVTNSLVRIPDLNVGNPPFDFPGSITVGAWVNPGAAIQPDGAGIVVKGNKGFEDFSLELTAAKTYRFTVANGAAVTSTSAFVVGQWTHLMGVFNTATPSIGIYVNGVLSSSTTLGVPATRSPTNGHDLVIGNKQSCAACALPYDLGFKGAIDEVRLISQALTDAQVFADYQSASTSTVVPPLPGGAIQIFLPPNAFGAPATIFVSTDPLNSPVRPDTNRFLQQGLLNLPTGHLLIPGSLFEIVPIVNGAPFSGPLGSSATVSIPYLDDGSGNVLGLNPIVSASSLVLYTLDTTVLRWNPLPTTVDTVGRRVYALTPHFSLFGGLGVSTVGTSLTQIFAYPSPWKIGTKTKFDAPAVTFANLPANGRVKIFTVSGELVKTIPFNSSNAGRATWDGGNYDGKPVGAGVYLAYVQVGDTRTGKVIKLAIEK